MNRILSYSYDYGCTNQPYSLALVSCAKEISEFCRECECEPISISYQHDHDKKIIEAMFVVKTLEEDG